MLPQKMDGDQLEHEQQTGFFRGRRESKCTPAQVTHTGDDCTGVRQCTNPLQSRHRDPSDLEMAPLRDLLSAATFATARDKLGICNERLFPVRLAIASGHTAIAVHGTTKRRTYQLLCTCISLVCMFLCKWGQSVSTRRCKVRSIQVFFSHAKNGLRCSRRRSMKFASAPGYYSYNGARCLNTKP